MMTNQQTNLQTTIHIINLLSLGFILFVIGFIAYEEIAYLLKYKTGAIEIIIEILFLLVGLFFLGIFNILPQILIWRATRRAILSRDHRDLLIITILVLANNIFWYHSLDDLKFIDLILMIAPLPAMLLTVFAYLYVRYISNK